MIETPQVRQVQRHPSVAGEVGVDPAAEALLAVAVTPASLTR